MSEWQILFIALLMGMLLGGFFFGGLWWTVRKSVASERPALWVFVSLLLRMSITLTGFYWIGAGDWRRLLMCLLGFILVRQLMTLPIRTAQPLPSDSSTPENQHAP